MALGEGGHWRPERERIAFHVHVEMITTHNSGTFATGCTAHSHLHPFPAIQNARTKRRVNFADQTRGMDISITRELFEIKGIRACKSELLT
jgi:hypothetical protein